MSEYQYYEFLAIDRPLTERERRELRAVSSRAVITATRFTNHYEWGNFKGDPRAWMEKYFDAFLYFANWGTRELMLRLPRRMLDPATAQRYCRGEAASARAKGEHVILEFFSEEDGDEWIEEEDGSLSSLVALRAEIAGGDLRALYLGWLLCAQAGELDDAEKEPPCPPGLGRLSAALEAFVAFMRVDRDLLEAAAAGSPEAEETLPAEGVERWVSGLPEAERTALLVRLIGGGEPHLRAELVRRFRSSRSAPPSGTAAGRRTVAELLEAAERRAEERRRREAERAARERARREREAAEARERHLASLARREAEAWGEVEALIATKQPGKYDAAVALLRDLRDLAVRAGRRVEVEARLVRLREQHAKKPSLIGRLRAAGLVGAG
ncbi:MAG TPA: hypothetical protein VE270_03290 [Thermoleophilaceae bacterium]|nr:hypothetical protein [Thermoleophilaceae bacterium]